MTTPAGRRQLGAEKQRKRKESKWSRARRLSKGEVWILVRAWGLLLFFDLALRLLPFKTVRRWGRSRRPRTGRSPSPVGVERTRQLVAAAGRGHLYSMTCLRQSLALQRILDSRGVETALRLGVRKENGQLHAHAWLERDGEPIGGSLADATRHSVLE